MLITRIPFIIIILLSACSSSSNPKPKTTLTPIHLPTILRDKTATTPDEGNLKRLVNAAKKDLAHRMDIPSDEIDMVRIENAEWPDTSLGCAKPGLTLRFVAVPGYRIILSANGRNYVYHTNSENGVVYCPKDKVR